MQFYADENFPRDVVVALRNLGHDVLTAFDDGKANQRIPDEDVLLRATALSRAVLTINRKDFKRLHRYVATHAGIVVCTSDSDFAGQARRIDEAVQHLGDVAHQLTTICRPPRHGL